MKLATMAVRRKQDGQRVVINEIDFDLNLHESPELPKSKSKPHLRSKKKKSSQAKASKP